MDWFLYDRNQVFVLENCQVFQSRQLFPTTTIGLGDRFWMELPKKTFTCSKSTTEAAAEKDKKCVKVTKYQCC